MCCCSCERLRQDLPQTWPLHGLQRHLPILLIAMLALPVVCGVGSLDAGRSAGILGSAEAEQTDE